MRPHPFLCIPVLCFVLLTCVSIAKAQDSSAYYLQQGSAYLDRGSYDSAILDFSNAIRIDSNNVLAYTRRGYVQSLKKQFAAAIDDYDKATDLDTNNSFAYNNRAYAYMQINKPDLAEFDLTRVIKLDSNATQAYADRGLAYAQQKIFVSAIRDYTKAIRLDSNHSVAYANRGVIYAQQNKRDSALHDLDKAIGFDSSSYQLYFYRGSVLSELNQFGRAIPDLTKAIRLQPDSVAAYSKRGYAYSQIRQFDSAIHDFTILIEHQPRNSDAYESRSLAWFEKKETDSAMRDISSSIRLNPDTARYYNTRGTFYNLTGNYESAIQDYRISIAKSPSYGKPYINIISPLIRLNSFDSATYYFELSRKKRLRTPLDDGINGIYRNFVTAVTLVSRGKMNEALTGINNVISQYSIGLNNDFKRAYLDIIYVKAYILEKKGSLEEARDLNKLSLILDPGQPQLEKNLVKIEKALTRGGDTKGPEITLINPLPTRGFEIVPDAKEIEVKVKVTDDSGVDSVVINGIRASVNDMGFFIASLKLNPALNSLQITATDKNGIKTNETFPVKKMAGENAKDDLEEVMKTRKYHAILIAENTYEDNGFKDLQRPISDAIRLRDVLVNQYTFDSANILMLFNSNQRDIKTVITSKLANLTDNDNLLIFYAGHGIMLNFSNKLKGYLVPTDARVGMPTDYINSEDISIIFALAQNKARHILMVLDACFSGTILRIEPRAKPGALSQQNALISRKVMTSGNVEEVPDSSIFLDTFIKSLQENENAYLSTNDIFKKINETVKNTEPKYETFTETDDTGGQFIFRRRKK